MKKNEIPIWGVSLMFLIVLLAGCADGGGLELNEADNSLDYFAVQLDNQWGVIDKEGAYAVNPVLKGIPNLTADGVMIMTSKGPEYYNYAGSPLFENSFLDGGVFSEGLAPVVRNGKVGFIDLDGSFVIEPQFAKASLFSEGLAAVATESRWGFVDRNGTLVINPQFKERPTPFIGGLSVVTIEGKRGYIDQEGQMVINPQFQAAGFFSEGLALVKQDGRYGYIGEDGKYKINPQFDIAAPFSEGRAHVKMDNSWGYINQEGELVINPQYEEASFFSGGLARVKTGGKWGYIDEDGEMVITPQFRKAGNFRKGVAPAAIESQFGLIDEGGTFTVNPQFSGMTEASLLGGKTDFRIFNFRSTEVERQYGPDYIAEKFLYAERRGNWEEAKKYATPDTDGAIELLSGGDATYNDPKEFQILDYEINGRSAVVFYQDEGSAQTKSIDLVKSGDSWLVAMEKSQIQEDLGQKTLKEQLQEEQGNGSIWDN